MSYDNIPQELKQLKQWVCFKMIPRENGSISKEPRNPKNGYWAKSNDPNTWTDFETAVKGVEKWNLDGIGFQFANGYVGVDLDHVLENGWVMDPAAEEILRSIDSYTEVSPSGTGLHIICRGQLPAGGNRKGNLEFYDKGRYFTMTGDIFDNKGQIKECTAAIVRMHSKYIGQQDPQQPSSVSSSSAPLPVQDTDEELVRKAAQASNGYLFTQLWGGDWSGAGYPSQSEADMAFVKILAYWTNGDTERMDSLYRQSGLMRDKWDRKQSGSTYGAITINNALKDFTPYSGPERLSAAEEFRKADQARQQDGKAPDQARALADAVAAASPLPNGAKPHPDSALDYLKGRFEKDVVKFMGYKDRKTGFKNLDRESTGLYPGLYVMGAISSLGKTTFCCQMMDNLAEAGEKVLYFSVEQNRMEMITKSLSRITAKNDLRDPVTGCNKDISSITKAVSAINIRRGRVTDEVKQAVKDYAKIAGNIDIVECGFGTTVEFIKSYVDEYMKTNQEKPVVFIDYLQVLKTQNEKISKQDRMDSIVTCLKKLQSDNDLVIVVISSLNRQNYLAPVDFESFKESGGIEYTADVVWGLQLQVMRSDELFMKEKDIIKKRKAVIDAKKAIPRKVELCCLKNRYGISSYYCAFQYDPRYDLFVEDYDFVALDESTATPFDENDQDFDQVL